MDADRIRNSRNVLYEHPADFGPFPYSACRHRAHGGHAVCHWRGPLHIQPGAGCRIFRFVLYRGISCSFIILCRSGHGEKTRSQYTSFLRLNISYKIFMPRWDMPIAEFFDLFYIGEGEISYDALFDLYKQAKSQSHTHR